MNIACFISSHGYGHATRSLAVIQKLSELLKINVSVFGGFPNWFIEENLNGINFKNYEIKTDVGLVQKNPFTHDLDETINQLSNFLRFKDDDIKQIEYLLKKNKPDFILCDISPLGIVLGKKLNIPVCLLENFTWDWIYREYESQGNELSKQILILKNIFESADMHIQTEPICKPKNGSFKVSPIFRPNQKQVIEVKAEIGIKNFKNIILVTTGGISQNYTFLNEIKNDKRNFYILAGDFKNENAQENFILLPHNNRFYFPDLVNIADVVVGKVGYGTVAEAWGFNKPLIGIYRKDFKESAPMRKFVNQNLSGFEIKYQSFEDGSWIKKIDRFTKKLKFKKSLCNFEENGRNEVAKIIFDWSENKFISNTH